MCCRDSVVIRVSSLTLCWPVLYGDVQPRVYIYYFYYLFIYSNPYVHDQFAFSLCLFSLALTVFFLLNHKFLAYT